MKDSETLDEANTPTDEVVAVMSSYNTTVVNLEPVTNNLMTDNLVTQASKSSTNNSVVLENNSSVTVNSAKGHKKHKHKKHKHKKHKTAIEM